MTLALQKPMQDATTENNVGKGLNEDLSLIVRIPEDPAARERLAVLLYDLRAVSQGKAAQIAGLTRAAFFDALGRHGVTPFQYEDEEEAVADAMAARL